MEASPKIAMPKGIPRLPVLPMMAEAVITDWVFPSLKKKCAIINPKSKDIPIPTKNQSGTIIEVLSRGLLKSPQKTKMGCRK